MSMTLGEHATLSTMPRWPRFSSSGLRFRAVVWQTLAAAMLCAVVALIANQTAANLKERGIASGFEYLSRATGFEISPGPLSYSSRDTYLRALAVGLINTLRVSLLGVATATLLGLLVGVARLSKTWVVASMARVYVEILRNTPLLLQLLFWYSLSQALPSPPHALRPLPGIFLCVRGLFLPRLVWNGSYLWFSAFGLILLLAFPLALKLYAKRRSRTLPAILVTAGVLVGMLVIATLTKPGPSVRLESPAFTGFNFQGGVSISPEFAALLIGLSTYTAAFIAEIVRGGILAVDRGQTEAAKALGFSRFHTLRVIILPQALRVIIPPATSQFLNLTKNSSLAVAIGYPDLISISNTTLNQTGQAIEAITVVMLIYLVISLGIALSANLYNRSVMERG
jgi:general L-amino acid transport system permease protein